MEDNIQKNMQALLKLINAFRTLAFEHEDLNDFEKDILRINEELLNPSSPKTADQHKLTRIALFRAVEGTMISLLMKQTDPKNNHPNIENKKYPPNLYNKLQQASKSLETTNGNNFIPLKSMVNLMKYYREETNKLYSAYPVAEVTAKTPSHRKKRTIPKTRNIEFAAPQEDNLGNLIKEEKELNEKLKHDYSQLEELQDTHKNITTLVSKNYLSDPLIHAQIEEINKDFVSLNLAIKERKQLQKEIQLLQSGPLPSPDASRVILTQAQAYNKLINNEKNLLTKFDHFKSSVKYSTERINLRLVELNTQESSFTDTASLNKTSTSSTLQNSRAELKTRNTQFASLKTEIISLIESPSMSPVDKVDTVRPYLEKHSSLAEEFFELINKQDDSAKPEGVILLESERLRIQSEKLQKNIIELQELKTKIVDNLVDLNKAIQKAEEAHKAHAKVVQVGVDLGITKINNLISKFENTAPYNTEYTHFIAKSKASLDNYRTEYSTSKPFKTSKQPIEEIQKVSSQALENLQVISNNIEATVKTRRGQFLAKIDALSPQINKLKEDGNISKDEVVLLNSKYEKLKGNLLKIHHFTLEPSTIVELDERLLEELKGDMKDLASKLNERSRRAESKEIILINRLMSLLENEIKEIKLSNPEDARLTIFNKIVEQINQDKTNYLQLKETPIVSNALTIINNNLTDENLNQLTSGEISLVAGFLTNLLQSIMEFLGVVEKKPYNTRFFTKNSVANLEGQEAYKQLSERVTEMENQIKPSQSQP